MVGLAVRSAAQAVRPRAAQAVRKMSSSEEHAAGELALQFDTAQMASALHISIIKILQCVGISRIRAAACCYTWGLCRGLTPISPSTAPFLRWGWGTGDKCAVITYFVKVLIVWREEGRRARLGNARGDTEGVVFPT